MSDNDNDYKALHYDYGFKDAYDSYTLKNINYKPPDEKYAKSYEEGWRQSEVWMGIRMPWLQHKGSVPFRAEEHKEYRKAKMTRSVTITNTSNWAEEDIYIIWGVSDKGEVQSIILEPGEMKKLPPNPDNKPLQLIIDFCDTIDEPEPFKTIDGKQTMPEAKVVWTNGEPG